MAVVVGLELFLRAISNDDDDDDEGGGVMTPVYQQGASMIYQIAFACALGYTAINGLPFVFS